MSALDAGLLLLGLVVGLTLAAHGAQKGLGWFGGPGIGGWTGRIASMGFTPAALFAWASMLAELLGGLGLALGLFTSVAAALVVAQTIVIVFHVHWRHGFWNTDRGIEYPLLIAAVAVCLGLGGRGALSLDGLLSSPLFAGHGGLVPAHVVMPPVAARIGLLLAGAVAGSLAIVANAIASRRAARDPDRRAGHGSEPHVGNGGVSR